jgi:hypothetical protein
LMHLWQGVSTLIVLSECEIMVSQSCVVSEREYAVAMLHGFNGFVPQK